MSVLATRPRDPRAVAFALLAVLFAVYNSNGRELGTVDSQPAKFTAREIAVKHTLTLDRIVAERPGLALRPAFALDRAGHYRSAYGLPSALFAAIPATLMHVTGLIDMDAPLAPNLVASVTASLLTAAAVALVFLALSRVATMPVALLAAVALGVGTNYWPLVSRTLWQHESVAFGLALALCAWLRRPADVRPSMLVLGGVGLAIAGSARPQLAPTIVLFLCWLAARAGVRRALTPAIIVGLTTAVILATNYHWFGHVLGAAPRLESMHPAVHAVSGTLSLQPWVGAAGLLISPSRGLLIFSPVVLVAIAGVPAAWRDTRESGTRWLLLAVAAQFCVYASYSVWWAGHTYGPRYLIDVLVPLAPIGALGAERLRSSRPAAMAAAVLLAWSVGVAALGAFVYPNDFWNTDPEEVDQHHERLWNIRDSQIPRAFHSHASPQNFDLIDRGAVRQ